MFSGKALASGGALHAQAFHGADAHGGFGSALAQGPDDAIWVGAPRARSDHGSSQRIDLRHGEHMAFTAGAQSAQTGEHDAH